MPTPDPEQWRAALSRHDREIETLTRTLERLEAALAAQAGEEAASDRAMTHRQIEFTHAQLTRHRISRALFASRLASGAGAGPAAYSHSIVAGGLDEMS